MKDLLQMTLQQVFSKLRDLIMKNQIPMFYRYHRLLSFLC